MGDLYQLILYQPIFNGLMAIHKFVPGHDLGVAIILLTLLMKLILFYPSLSSLKSQRALQDLQPKITKLREKYKDDRQKQGQELMKLYRENKVSPLSSCLPMILQLVLLIPLYQAFINGLKTDPETHLLVADQLNNLYGSLRSIYETAPINLVSFGFLNLGAKGGIVLGLIAGGLQFWQTWMLSRKKGPKGPAAKDENVAASVNRQMLYLFPLLTIYLVSSFPAGIGVYWIVSTLFQLLQQWYFLKRHLKPPVDGQQSATSLPAGKAGNQLSAPSGQSPVR